jgi:hypothetical protein
MLHLFFHELTPPSVKLDADLEFVLRVAFGPNCDDVTRPQSGDGALRWARQLGLERRIGERLTADQAPELLGPAIARELEVIREQMAVDKLAREEVHQRLVAAVAACEVDVVLCRQAALASLDLSSNPSSSAFDSSISASARQDPSGSAGVEACLDPSAIRRTSSGFRAAASFRKTSILGFDKAAIDVLVQGSDLDKLTMALIGAGCTARLRGTGEPPSASSKGRTAVFLGQRGATILLHTHLRFLRMVPGGVFIDLACLKRCGQLLRDDATQNKNLWLPSKAVQAADWTAQALVEQRFALEYPAVSAWLDAQTLGLDDDVDLAFDAYLMLQTDVEHAEFEALRELLRALKSGELGNLSKRARTLFNHAIAAATSPGYRAKLRLQRKAQMWQQEGHLERAAEGLGRVLRRIKGKS